MPAAHSSPMQHNAREERKPTSEREREREKECTYMVCLSGSVGFYTVHCSLDWNLYVLTTSSATSCSHANKQSRIESIGAKENVIERERERERHGERAALYLTPATTII